MPTSSTSFGSLEDQRRDQFGFWGSGVLGSGVLGSGVLGSVLGSWSSKMSMSNTFLEVANIVLSPAAPAAYDLLKWPLVPWDAKRCSMENHGYMHDLNILELYCGQQKVSVMTHDTPHNFLAESRGGCSEHAPYMQHPATQAMQLGEHSQSMCLRIRL